MLRFLIMTGASFLLLGTAFFPSAHAGDLATVERKLEDSRRQQLEQEALAKARKKERDEAQDKLLSLAAAIRRNEDMLLKLEDRIATLDGEQQQIMVRLESDYGSIGNLMLALQKLRRVPAESLLLRPGAPLETAQTALLLRNILPAVTQRAETLSADLERLAAIRKTLEDDRAAARATNEALASERQEMGKLLADREKLYARAESAYAETGRAVQKLASEAADLRELMQKLAQREKEEERKRNNTAVSPRADRVVSSASVTLPSLGKAQSPVAGMIRTAYGEKDAIGAHSEGITIESAAHGMIIAPMGGIVRFAGPFKNYGNMVIIEHKKDYHSLLSGLHRLDVREGQSVNAGEPVGVLPASSSLGGKPTLYYELRQKGRPVDPSSAISGLKS